MVDAARTRTEARALAATERGRTVRDFWVSLLEKKQEWVIGQLWIDARGITMGGASRVRGSTIDTKQCRRRTKRTQHEKRAQKTRAGGSSESLL